MNTSKYKPTIGLEIHAELNTKTKMFCNSKNDPNEKEPNVNICPVCMAHPGTLPVINKEAVKSVLKVGIALGSELAMDFTEFDRKNYFYPDIPKGYQISQYKYPLVSGGRLKDVDVTRVHLEEDTASSSHTAGDYSLVDFNRAGVPLMELVTEPVITEAKQAGDFARELQLLLRYLGVSKANMEKGEMRVEANISVSSEEGKLGTKVEVKNLNSFKVVEKAIDYEIKRQIEALESGEKIIQETRGWDDNSQKTFSQRIKEEANDYRYFPEPDLPKLVLNEIPEFAVEELKKEIPELPQEKRERYKESFSIKDEDIESFVQDEFLGKFFEEVISASKGDSKFTKLASNYITSDLVGLMKTENLSEFKISSGNFASLIGMAIENKLSSRGVKDVLAIMYKEGGDPEKIAGENRMLQKSDEGELKKIVEEIIEENSSVVEEYKNGKESALQFLVGQGMKATKGSANPVVLKGLISKSI
ncbi:Asp-tRNA(Asn)/Glu-tRNA(Gln) amidotransferase subunit GatB [Patescibacteria group bacterium]